MTYRAGTRTWGARAGWLLAVGATALIGCTTSPSASGSVGAALERRLVEITTHAGDTVAIEAELADTEESRAVGLSGRATLPADAGLVLLHDEPATIQLWMKDTTIPLSAAWFDEAGRIVWIEDLDPCEADPCPLYAAPDPVIGVLEVNQGAFRDWGVSVGDTLEFDPPLP